MYYEGGIECRGYKHGRIMSDFLFRLLTSYMNLGKVLEFSSISFLICKIEKIVLSLKVVVRMLAHLKT